MLVTLKTISMHVGSFSKCRAIFVSLCLDTFKEHEFHFSYNISFLTSKSFFSILTGCKVGFYSKYFILRLIQFTGQ